MYAAPENRLDPCAQSEICPIKLIWNNNNIVITLLHAHHVRFKIDLTFPFPESIYSHYLMPSIRKFVYLTCLDACKIISVDGRRHCA